MAISKLQPVSTVSSNTTYLTATTQGTRYDAPLKLIAGVYSVVGTDSSGSYSIEIYNGSTLLTTVSVNGLTPTTVNLATPSTKVWFFSKFGTPNGSQIGFTLTGVPLVSTTVSGTLDVLTTSQTYTRSATNCYIMCVGGGGGGNSYTNTGYGVQAGGGGGSGGVLELGPVTLSGSYAVTIGAGGAGNNGGSGTSGGSGGSTSFGSLLTATGGGGGYVGQNGGNGGGGGGVGAGTPTYSGSGNGAQGYNGGNGGNTNTTPTIYAMNFQWVRSGAVAGGVGGGGSATGLGGGIGTGGNGNGSNATGYGCGGGGSSSSTAYAGNGSPGVVYVLYSVGL